MTHHFTHACAGFGKTQYIVNHCTQGTQASRLVITLTTTGQNEIEERLQKATNPSTSIPEVTGWYSFLINHIVRPYLPNLFPTIRPTGFIFDRAMHPKNHYNLHGESRYFSPNRSIYKETLSELAVNVAKESQGAVEKRLSRIYDEIIIDEVQDISRKSLDIIERLLTNAKPRLILVGDVRQSLLDSELSSTKNKNADRVNLMKWYRKFEEDNLLTIDEKNETHRFNQTIANFSDTIFPKELKFPPTLSRMNETYHHDGVFLVAKEDLTHYHETFKPTILRHSIKSWKSQSALNPINFGESKGRTYSRVMILATKPIENFCLKEEKLNDKSACGFYVAVTRARYSVAIVINKSRATLIKLKPSIPIWQPQLPPTLF